MVLDLGECETVTLLHEIVKHCHLPMVIDADGLWAVGSNLRLLEEKQHVILTPTMTSSSKNASTFLAWSAQKPTNLLWSAILIKVGF